MIPCRYSLLYSHTKPRDPLSSISSHVLPTYDAWTPIQGSIKVMNAQGRGSVRYCRIRNDLFDKYKYNTVESGIMNQLELEKI